MRLFKPAHADRGVRDVVAPARGAVGFHFDSGHRNERSGEGRQRAGDGDDGLGEGNGRGGADGGPGGGDEGGLAAAVFLDKRL